MKSITAVKLVGETDEAWVIEGLILPYGGPLRGQDLTGTHFSKSTDFCLDWFPEGGRPGLYAHGFDEAIKTSVVGREIKSWLDDKGRWLQAQIDKAHEYGAEIKELVDGGLLSLSSGAVDHLVQIATKSGEIKRWPWVEWSLVPNPANPEALVYPVKSFEAADHLRAVGFTDPVDMVEGGIVVTKMTRAAVADLERQGLTIKTDDQSGVVSISRGTKAAADDASWAASLISSIAYIMADEAAEPDQLEMLRNAVGWLQTFVDAELAEVGTPADNAEAAAEAAEATLEMMAWLSLRQAAPLAERLAKASPAIADPDAIRSLHASTTSLVATLGAEAPTSDPGAARLVITTGAAAKAEPDLAALTADMTALATATAREALGLPPG